MTSNLDTYSLRARLAPLLLVILPSILGVAVWLPIESEPWKMLGSLGMSCALTFLLAQLGRDPGRNKQEALFASWDGRPTTRYLRHRDGTIDPHTKSRYHGKLQILLPNLDLPTARAEKGNPTAADKVYESAVKHLLEATRNKKSHPLIFEANVTFGFRRNLWGMKPAGIANAMIGLTSSIANVCYQIDSGGQVSATSIGSIGICGLLLTWWLLRITPTWVKLGADAYAERLLAACEVLEPLALKNEGKPSSPEPKEK